MKHLLPLTLSLALLAPAEESKLNLVLRPWVMNAPAAAQALELNVQTLGAAQRVLVGIKPQDRTNVRLLCLALDRKSLGESGRYTIQQLLPLGSEQCSGDERVGQLEVTTRRLTGLSEHLATVHYVEAPLATPLRIRYNGKLIFEGKLNADLQIVNGEAVEQELKGLQTLVLAATR